MGAATYESVLADAELLEHPERWQQAHGDRPAWVFTHRDLPPVPGANITFARGDIRQAHEAMVRAAGDRTIFVAGGGGLAATFAEAELLDEIVVAVVPVMLGEGKPLFGGRLSSSRLRLAKVEQKGQVVFLTYEVRNPPAAA